MRVTDLATERNFLYNIGRSEARLGRLQDMASSGMRFSRPQDDPVGVERSIAIRHHLSQNQQYLRNLDRAKTWMGETEQALADLTAVITRAQTLAAEGGTSTTPPEARAQIAMEVRQLVLEAASIGDRVTEGRKLLAGTLPVWKVGPGVTITARDLSSFMALVDDRLRTLEAGLETGGDVSLVEAARQGLSEALDMALAERAENGAKMNRLDMLEGKMKNLDIEYRRLLSNVEDVDLTETIVKLRAAEASYQAALGVGARLLQSTLLDYLR